MKNIFLFITIIAFLFSCDKSDPSPAISSDDQAVADDLNMLAKQIEGIEADLSSNDLAFLDDIADARMIGMGEATHGSKEFLQMKYRMFRYLAEKHQFRGVVFEIDVAEAMIFEDYVQGRRDDDIANLMKENMYFWVWKTKEVRDMLFWMRAYNASRSEADRVHIFGMDCQTTFYNADRLISIVKKADAAFAEDIKDHLQLYRRLMAGGDTSNSEIISKQIDYVVQSVNDHRAELISGGLTLEDFDNVVHLARVLDQTHELLYATKSYDYTVRDRFMAENAQWVLDHLNGGQNSKITLWAHDFHVATGSGDQNEGSILRTKLQNNYKSVGFAFGKGAFNAVDPALGYVKFQTITSDPLENSISHFFSLSNRKMFSLNLAKVDASHPGLLNLISTDHLFITIGSTYNGKPDDYYGNLTLRNNFDIVLYFDKVFATELLY
ncbi:MAG: erythromycin esterase family protein [Chryseolinea sp.]